MHGYAFAVTHQRQMVLTPACLMDVGLTQKGRGKTISYAIAVKVSSTKPH